MSMVLFPPEFFSFMFIISLCITLHSLQSAGMFFLTVVRGIRADPSLNCDNALCDKELAFQDAD